MGEKKLPAAREKHEAKAQLLLGWYSGGKKHGHHSLKQNLNRNGAIFLPKTIWQKVS